MGYFAYRKICRETLAIATTSIIQTHRFEKENGQRPNLEMWQENWQRGYNWMWHGMMWENPDDYNTRLSEERQTFDLYQVLKSDDKFRVGFGRCCKYAIAQILREIKGFNTRCTLQTPSSIAPNLFALLVKNLFVLSGQIGNVNNTENSLINNEIRNKYREISAIIDADKLTLMNLSNILNQASVGALPEIDKERCEEITKSWNTSFGWD